VKDLDVSYRFDEVSTESKSEEDPNYDPDDGDSKKVEGEKAAVFERDVRSKLLRSVGKFLGDRKVGADGKLTTEEVREDEARAAKEKLAGQKSKADKAKAEKTAAEKAAKDKEAGKANRILIETVGLDGLRVLKKDGPVKCDPKTKKGCPKPKLPKMKTVIVPKLPKNLEFGFEFYRGDPRERDVKNIAEKIDFHGFKKIKINGKMIDKLNYALLKFRCEDNLGFDGNRKNLMQGVLRVGDVGVPAWARVGGWGGAGGVVLWVILGVVLWVN
jgi:hypothetical protein